MHSCVSLPRLFRCCACSRSSSRVVAGMPPQRARDASDVKAAAPDALRCGLYAAQLAKLETLEEATDAAELRALLGLAAADDVRLR